MRESKPNLESIWVASGVLTKDGIRLIGRPPISDAPKKQVTLRLDAYLIDRFRATGIGRQSRISEALRKAAGFNLGKYPQNSLPGKRIIIWPT